MRARLGYSCPRDDVGELRVASLAVRPATASSFLRLEGVTRDKFLLCSLDGTCVIACLWETADAAPRMHARTKPQWTVEIVGARKRSMCVCEGGRGRGREGFSCAPTPPPLHGGRGGEG